MTQSENLLITFIKVLSAGLFIVMSVSFLFLLYMQFDKEETIITEVRREYVYDEFLTRERINDTITEHNYFYILAYYTEQTGSRNIAEAILDTALEKQVPVNIAFALSFVESSFDPDALNESNRNGTVDRGLFQLNSATFRDSNIDFFNPYESAEAGLTYLLGKYERYGSWESAIVMYNAGVEANLSNRSLTYLTRILEKERFFDEGYNTFRRDINYYRNRNTE